MKKHYIRYDDKYFRIDLDEKAPKFVEASIDEILEFNMESIILKDKNDLDVSVFQDVVDKARENLRSALKNNIEETVLQSLGFSKKWGDKWEVDHCNGRMSIVTDLISKEIKQSILDEQAKPTFTISDKVRDELRTSMHKDFKELYLREARRATERLVADQISKDINYIAKEISREQLKPLADELVDNILRVRKIE
jgi:hypothetical protein